MTLTRRHIVTLAAAAAATLSAAVPAAALAQSDVPLRLIVPYPAGGPLDRVARILAEATKDSLGTIVVENRAGAGGNIGADHVAKSAPDGRSIVMGAVATHAINPWLFAKMPYDPVRDFTPITLVAQVPNVLVMNAEAAQRLNVRTLADLVAYAKANPAKLNYGSGGNGSAGHLAGEMFKQQAGIFALHIPYRGGAAAQQALLGGQVDFNIDNLATASGNIRAGRLVALAVTTPRRAPSLPDVPTMAEAGRTLGLANFNVDTWFGLFGPAGIPPATTRQLNEAFTAALRLPEVREKFAPMMAEPAPTTPEAFGAFVQAELAKYRDVVKATGARVD